MSRTKGIGDAGDCFSNYVLKYWLLHVGRTRRRKFLQKLKSDLIWRLPREHVRTALIQLTTEPTVLLRRRESDGRCLNLAPGKPVKKESGQDQHDFSVRWCDEETTRHVKKELVSRRLFNSDKGIFPSVKLSKKLCQAQWTEPHPQDVKRAKHTTDVVKITDLKVYDEDLPKKGEIPTKEVKTKEVNVARDAQKRSDKDKTESLQNHKELPCNRQLSSCAENQTKDALLKESAIWKNQKVCVVKSSEQTSNISGLVSERINTGAIRIPVQLNIAHLNINLIEMAAGRRNYEEGGEDNSNTAHGSNKKDIVQRVFRCKNKSNESVETETKSSKSGHKVSDSVSQKKDKKRHSTEVIVNTPKRRKLNKSTSFRERKKCIKKNILKKFYTLFGECVDSSEEQENKSLIRKRIRKERNCIAAYDTGFGISNDQNPPKKKTSKKVHWAKDLTKNISTEKSNSEKGPMHISEAARIRGTIFYRHGKKDENANSVATEECCNNGANADEEHHSVSNSSRTASPVTDCLNDSQTTVSSSNDIINLVETSTDSCDSNSMNSIADEIFEISDETDYPDSPGSVEILPNRSPIVTEISSDEETSQDAVTGPNNTSETNSNDRVESSESSGQVVNAADNINKDSVLKISSNKCTNKTTATAEVPKEARVENASSPDTSSNVERQSDTSLQKDNNWMDDMNQLLQMGLDKNCEIIADGNTVHIPPKESAQSKQTADIQGTEVSCTDQLNVDETSREDSSQALCLMSSEDPLDKLIAARIADAKEKRKVGVDNLVESMQTKTDSTEQSLSLETSSEQVPEIVIVNDNSWFGTVSTDTMQVPKPSFPKLRVLSNEDVGTRWCPSSNRLGIVGASKSNSLSNSIVPNGSLAIHPPVDSVVPINDVQRNSHNISEAEYVKKELVILLKEITETVKYLRYLQGKNELDRGIPNKHIRQKQMNQNLSDFIQSTEQFRTEFVQLSRLLRIKSFNLLIRRTVPHLNVTELRDLPLSYQEFAAYWNCDVSDNVIPNAIRTSIEKAALNKPSIGPANVQPAVTASVPKAAATASLQYNNAIMPNNAASSSNVPLQYKMQPTRYASLQQCTPMNTKSIPASTRPQRVLPTYEQALAGERSLYLPTPVEEYNRQTRTNQPVIPQNSTFTSNRHSENTEARGTRWHYTRVPTNPRLQQSSGLNKSYSRPSISEIVSLHKPSNPRANIPAVINPPQQILQPAYYTQTEYVNAQPAQVQPQLLQLLQQPLQQPQLQLQHPSQHQPQQQPQQQPQHQPQYQPEQQLHYQPQQQPQYQTRQQTQHESQHQRQYQPQHQSLQTQIQSTQYVGEFGVTAPANVQPLRPQTVTVPPNVTYTQQAVPQSVRQDAPQSVQRQIQTTTKEKNPQPNLETNAQSVPIIQTSFMNVTMLPSGAGEISNNGTVIDNVAVDNDHTAASQQQVQTANTAALANSSVTDTPPKSPSVEHFSMLQKIMLRNQIQACLFLPMRGMLKYFAPTERAQIKSHRMYLTEFFETYEGFVGLPQTMSGWSKLALLQKKGKNGKSERGKKDKSENAANAAKMTQKKSTECQSDQNTQEETEWAQDENSSSANGDRVESTNSQIVVLHKEIHETQSAETVNTASGDFNTSTNLVRVTLQNSNNEDPDKPNSQHNTQVDSATVLWHKPSASQEQAQPSLAVTEPALKNTEVYESRPDIRIVLNIISNTSTEAAPVIGKSLPMLEDSISDGSPKALCTEKLNSLPVLYETLVEDTVKVSNDSESMQIANSDNQPTTLLSPYGKICEEIYEKHVQPMETINVRTDEEKRGIHSSLNAKEHAVSSGNETEKTVTELYVNSCDKLIECINLADINLSSDIPVEDVSLSHVESIKTSTESQLLESVNSQSTEIQSQTISQNESINLDESSSEFQPNILNVTSISLRTFSRLEERSPEIELGDPSENTDVEDVALAAGTVDENTIDMMDKFLKRRKEEQGKTDEREPKEEVKQEKVEEKPKEEKLIKKTSAEAKIEATKVEEEKEGVDYQICLKCGKRSTVVCGKCLTASYCSKGCQELHWIKHFSNCKRHPLSTIPSQRKQISKK